MLGYRCVCCDADHEPVDLLYACARCGGNLEVVHDARAWAGGPGQGAHGDLRRYHRAIGLPTDFAPPLPLRLTPLLDVRGKVPGMGDLPLWLKDETSHPSASLKDRATYVVVARSLLTRGRAPIVAASTGNAGASLACLCAAAGVPATVFVPASAPQAKRVQLRIYGADLREVEGTYDDAFQLSLALAQQQGWTNRNTGTNPWTREGKKTVAFEIADQMASLPDWIVVPTGDGNILSAVWKGLRELRDALALTRLPRLIAAQARGSAALSHALERRRRDPALSRPDALVPVVTDTLADSISVGAPADGVAALRALEESGGETVVVDDDAILAAIPALARATGVFVEPAAAASVAALAQALAQGTVRPHERVVVLATGNGLKDVGAATQALAKLPKAAAGARV